MFKIGEFARLNKVTIKTLRHYDELDILKPISIDKFTGYRYYSSTQISRLYKIISLKNIGFSLSQIKTLIDSNLNEVGIISMLEVRQEEIKENLKLEQEKLERVKSIIKIIRNEEENFMLNYNVVVKEVESLKVASIRDIISEYSNQGHLWQELMEHLNQNNVKLAQPCMAIYYDPGYKEKDVDIDVAAHITADCPETERVKVKYLPNVKEMACVIHKGSYQTLQMAYSSIMKWIENNGYKITEPIRELYLEGDWCCKSPDEYITEIQIPVEKNN